jgi:hypothetical protein
MQKLTFFLLMFLSVAGMSQEQAIVNHNLTVKADPETSIIQVIDSITISGEWSGEFILNNALGIKSSSEKLEQDKVKDGKAASDIGMDRNQEGAPEVSRWQVKGKANSFVVSYEGKIKHEISSSEENYQRGFGETTGIISEQGIYLAGSTFWVPTVNNALATYSLIVNLPDGWKSVSQGEKSESKKVDGNQIDNWICDKPQEEIFLIGAKFSEYTHEMASGVKAMAFLRTPDEQLANKYLGVTEQYMLMYEEMLGDYPYSKFALVENFWETGYGMPSFTLLGEKIIRFPWILHSSYPHELLHNWWGNSVYVDFESGNWCEGITAYMADHLIKEQQGQGEEYRRSVLQKYSNYVGEEKDFPLNEFISRFDGISEAVGYGKALMVWHQLRRQVGDEMFLEGFKLFYEKYRYKVASYSDIRVCFEEVSGADLKPYFNQWIQRTGAPSLVIEDVSTSMFNGQFNVSVNLKQVQDVEVFEIAVPIHVLTKDGTEAFVFNMNQKEQSFQMNLKSKPLKVEVDPQYDIFRILDRNEVPPTLSKIWSSNNNLFILPSKANEKQKEIYLQLAEQWKAADNDNFEIIYDSELAELPADKTLWVLGFENKFAEILTGGLAELQSGISSDSITLNGQAIPKAGNSFTFTSFDIENPERQNLFIACDVPEAVPGLVRKLPHYGKYSFLAFKGDEPTNFHKGQWPVLNSPMVKVLDERSANESLILNREALATLPVLFSKERMMEDIKYLASEELKGRGIGTPEIDKAAEYIARKFKEAGLKPFDKSYFQKFSHTFKDKGEMELTNVIGVIPGTDPKLKDNPVVVSAHYDHLGLGWPDVHAGDEGKIHFGADDNASGVATILELARAMGNTAKPKRTIIFLACTAEEAGLIGSRYFVEHFKDYYSGEIFANVNIDTDGSLFDKKLLVLNGNSAREWKFIFMGTEYTTGIASQVVEKPLDASDQMAFIEKGIPAIQLFTGPTENYHRPSDTWDKIDADGLVKVTTVSKEVIEYLASREEPMTVQIEGATQKPQHPGGEKTSRKVSTGAMPDFAFQGEGVKVGSVKEGSAGDAAGLKAGDIIVGLNGTEITGLKQYSDLLKQFKQGDEVNLKVLRGDETKTLKLKLGSR